MLGACLEEVRRQRPLIHNITNYVTAGACANVLLALGASPIMADAPEEAAEITAACRGLNLNLGTPHRQRLAAMLAAGEEANRRSLPVVLDPVGAGASQLRKEMIAELFRSLRFAAVRGNLSEIKTLAELSGSLDAWPQSVGLGVDAAEADGLHRDDLPLAASLAQRLAARTGAVVIVTGELDIVADARQVYQISNGHPMLRMVTGSGCALSAMTAAFLAANPERPLEAAVTAVCSMGVCGELAFEHLQAGEGSGSYRIRLMDAISLLDGEMLEQRARYRLLVRQEGKGEHE